MSNSNITKRAIAISFKNLMETTAFDKISVSDITDGCGLNRQTFYYHFQDKYELINWIFYNEVINVVSKNITIENWEKGITQFFMLMKKDKKFYLNAIRHTNAEFNNYIFKVAMNEFESVVKDIQQALNKEISAEDTKFICSFFAYGTTGIITSWIENGMKDEPETVAKRLANATKDCEKLSVMKYLGQIS